ncbi:MAG: VanW family protein [Candidatus Moranbacteria bacterium]|nr:VanW family protein [Candidatus Moranbacteria bacterium]
MKPKIFFVVTIFLFLPFATHAEELNLGDFSVDKVQEVIGSPIYLHFSGQKFAVDKTSLLGWLKIRPSLKIKSGYRSEAENINFSPASEPNLTIFFRFLTQNRDRYHTKISTNLSIDDEALKKYLENAQNETRVAPENAKLAFSDGKVSAFAVSKNGSEINPEKSFEKIRAELEKNPYAKDIEVETNILKPEVSSSDVAQSGIKELIATGTSNFRGSPKNRIHNISVGAARFNGVLIKPGEEFSFIKTLGPVDASTGYLPELVIKVDKTIPEYGGGMCQVSTTCFRAALNAGLKITARTNHAYPVQYYAPQGTDATVYIPNPDLRFVNDTPGYILIQTHIEGTQLTFDFYGTSDGRQTKLIGPTVTSRGEGGAMKTDLFQEVYGADGNLIRKAEFKSNYDSPSKYPHPGEEKITEKPTDWSAKEWKAYKKANGL